MAATSPAPTRAAAALTLAPHRRVHHVHMPSGRPCPCRTSAAPRRRAPRCRAKPTVKGVVDDDEDASRESEPERNEEEAMTATGTLPGWLTLDTVGMDILSIAAPAVLALAADPIAALVDTAFVGHIGSTELAAVGVSISIFNLVSKLFNVPLLNVTTSFVAEQQAVDDSYRGTGENNKLSEERKFLPAVTTSLALASGIGLMETLALIFGSGTLMDVIGIPVDSPVRIPAEQFLTFRAYGAPPIIVALAAQGAFRGLMDTKTPLYAIGVGNLVNAILDAIFVFPLGLGVRGAALATVTSEYVKAIMKI
uniref:Protein DETOXIFICATION n=1 Tax=Triticum urartu TaxID=4572 RepID=A0A8R7QER5_TRIUA